MSALYSLDDSPTTVRFGEAFNDSDSLMVYDATGGLGKVEPYWTGCRWYKVRDARGVIVAHVRRYAQALPRALIGQILTDARNA